MRLLGYELEPETLRPGERARVALLWLATGALSVDYRVWPGLWTREGREVASAVGPAAGGTHPTSRWRPDDLVRDVHSLTPPADLPRGEHVLAASALPPRGPRGEAATQGTAGVR